MIGITLRRTFPMTDQAVPSSPACDEPRVTNLFPTPLIRVRHPDAVALNRRLLSVILQQEKTDPGVTHSNDGGWQSLDDFTDWAGADGKRLVDFARAFANRISAVSDPRRGLLECELDWSCNAWANINRSGHANAPHTHPGAYWSGVYYVDDGAGGDMAEQGGELEFMDPRGAMPNMLAPDLKMKVAGCLSAGLSHLVTPQSGTLVMFPSWLMHAVRRYSGARPRVSIAMNFALPARV